MWLVVRCEQNFSLIRSEYWLSTSLVVPTILRAFEARIRSNRKFSTLHRNDSQVRETEEEKLKTSDSYIYHWYHVLIVCLMGLKNVCCFFCIFPFLRWLQFHFPVVFEKTQQINGNYFRLWCNNLGWKLNEKLQELLFETHLINSFSVYNARPI